MSNSQAPCCMVYIWLPGASARNVKSTSLASQLASHTRGIGHAAMQIGPEWDPDLYVSWWPEGSAGPSSILPGKKFNSSPNSRFIDDLESEGSDALNYKVNLASTMLRYFPSGHVDPTTLESMFHGGMLGLALLQKQSEIEEAVEEGFQGDAQKFSIELASELNKSFNNHINTIKDASIQKLDIDNCNPWQIQLSGLDLKKMITEWYAIRDKPGAHYRSLRKNCSTVVHRVLAAGGGDKKAGFLASKTPFWTPSRLFHYCQKIQKHTK